MKKYIVTLLILTALCFTTGCELNVNISDDGYKNTNTKKPYITESPKTTTAPGNSSEPGSDGPIMETDGENNIVDSDNSSQTTENPKETGTPSVNATDGTGSIQDSETDLPGVTGTSTSKPNSTSSDKPTSYPTVSPTAPPVITQGPKEYFILTVDNGGGGGYAYINQGVDTDTGIEGATNVNKGWFAAGSYASISAVPYEGCTFGGWYIGDDFVSPDADYTFVMPERDYPLTALFIFLCLIKVYFCDIYSISI